MQLIFVLSCFALCIAVRGQSRCRAPKVSFREDERWLKSESETEPPNGETFPSRKIGKAFKAFKADPTNARLLESRMSETSQSKVAAKLPCSPKKCPYHYDYIWKINGCWIVKTIPVSPFIALRPLRFAHCETRKCNYTSWFIGRCRPSLFLTYRYLLVACKKGNIWYFKWIPGPTLPHCCRCNKC